MINMWAMIVACYLATLFWKFQNLGTQTQKQASFVNHVPNRLLKKLGARADVIWHHHITREQQMEFKKSLTSPL